MREILFRGKRVDNGEWVYGSFIPDLMEVFCGDTRLDGFIKPYAKTKEERLMREVLRETVGQYTGLTDKNGNKIFEGDILKTSIGCIFSVEWEKEGRFLGFTSERKIVYVNREPKAEVIGNIHDNPELLEVNS